MRSPRVAIKIDGKIGKSGNGFKKPHNKAIFAVPGFENKAGTGGKIERRKDYG